MTATRIVFVGAGPGAAMLLERLLANHAATAPETELDIRLVDPYGPAGGRIWRREQSPLLKLNSMLEDVAFFTDDSCVIEGPIAPGPSFAEWVRLVRAGEVERPEWADARLSHEIEHIGDRDFPTRRLNNAYLGWAYRETLRRAAPTAAVQWIRGTVIAVEEAAEVEDRAARTVTLDSGETLDADIVVHAVGHNGSLPSNDAIRLAAFADRHGLGYVAPAFTADVDLDWVPAGEDVIVRGLGLAAVDLVVLLAEGRGGRFVRRPGGALGYLRSGREPILHLGSRRGVPYRSKITSTLQGEPVALEYLGPEFHAGLAGRTEPLDFDRDVWPLIAAELVTGYYRELVTGHPERVAGDWAEFRPLLRAALAAGHDSVELAELIRERVPDPLDRFDLASFDRPLDFPLEPAPAVPEPGTPESDASGPDASGTRPAAAAEPDPVTARVRAHIVRDLRLRTEPERSAVQGLFLTMLFAYMSVAEVPAEKWNARSRTVSLPKHWHSYFSYLASGPPGHRLEELLALVDAGVVRFLGGDVALDLDEARGVFVASGSARVAAPAAAFGDTASPAGTGSSTGVARARVTARTLIDAWLPEAQAATSDNPLLRQLVASGQARELAVSDATHSGSTGQIEVDADGALPGAPGQFALGPFAVGLSGGAFTRPGLNSLPFRSHDRRARAILAAVQGFRRNFALHTEESR